MHKTRKAKTSKKDVTIFFLELLNTIKIYHWNTYDYSAHKATDELYSSLSDNVDKFMEVYMGSTNQRISLSTKTSISLNNLNKNSMKFYIQKTINHLEKIKLPLQNTDLYNIRDEMLANLNQFLYLFTFK
jgi:DNA-binding ferritin-like protein